MLKRSQFYHSGKNKNLQWFHPTFRTLYTILCIPINFWRNGVSWIRTRAFRFEVGDVTSMPMSMGKSRLREARDRYVMGFIQILHMNRCMTCICIYLKRNRPFSAYDPMRMHSLFPIVHTLAVKGGLYHGNIYQISSVIFLWCFSPFKMVTKWFENGLISNLLAYSCKNIYGFCDSNLLIQA